MPPRALLHECLFGKEKWLYGSHLNLVKFWPHQLRLTPYHCWKERPQPKLIININHKILLLTLPSGRPLGKTSCCLRTTISLSNLKKQTVSPMHDGHVDLLPQGATSSSSQKGKRHSGFQVTDILPQTCPYLNFSCTSFQGQPCSWPQ